MFFYSINKKHMVFNSFRSKKFICIDDYILKNNRLMENLVIDNFNNNLVTSHYSNERFFGKVKFIVGIKEEFIRICIDNFYKGNIIYNIRSQYLCEDCHTYYIGKNLFLYRYCIILTPFLFGKKISIEKNEIDDIMIEHFNNNILFDINKSKKSFYKKLKHKGIYGIEIKIKNLIPRNKNNNITIFRINDTLKKEKIE